MRSHKKILPALVCAACICASDARAVYLDPDGVGQALIYPYYTTRSADGNPFNTYISVVNTSSDAKAVRVRFREPLAGKAVLDFNLFLSPNDAWTAAVVLSSNGGVVAISHDESCTKPSGVHGKDGAYTFTLQPAAYVGDGLGDEVDRLREGYVEMIEMAALTGPSAAAVTQANGVPDDCGAIRAATVLPSADIAPPSGGLIGTLTLINVASGEDFTVNAVALARLSDAPFYRDSPDPYPDFAAGEILGESQMILGGTQYNLDWPSGRDAVSSVLMSTQVLNEFVRDHGTNSQTDWVLTMPTRHLYLPNEAPFTAQANTGTVLLTVSDREASNYTLGSCFPMQPACPVAWSLNPVSVLAFVDGAAAPSIPGSSAVLGSRNVLPVIDQPLFFESGWARYELNEVFGWSMESAPTSTAYDPVTRTTMTGRFRIAGLPITGLMVRTFKNGTLHCGAASCQGNYGGSFSHRYRRAITYIGP